MGFFALWMTLLFRPERFFARPPDSRWRPRRFAAAMTVVAVAVNVLAVRDELHDRGMMIFAFVGGALLAPLVGLLPLYFGAALTHGLLRLVGVRDRPFADTFRCACYATAPLALEAVPSSGPFLAPAWGLIILAVGLAHDRPAVAWRIWLTVVGPTVTLIGGVLLLRAFVLESFRLGSGGMIPTLQIEDHIFADKWTYRWRPPHRGEVIVFHTPLLEPDMSVVKRVIAVGGDTVEIRDDVLYLNDQPVPREHVAGRCERRNNEAHDPRGAIRPCDAWRETLGGHTYTVIFDSAQAPSSLPPLRVRPGATFVLGDNRDRSSDSRAWGLLPDELLIGRVARIWRSGPLYVWRAVD